ncbi:ABC-F family ATP-binding cassette domain-containing protein [bacterium]|nr:ABC-F family ATP-binding cassette domain-containing protein [bacterium]
MSLVQVNEVGMSFAGFNLLSRISFNIDQDSRIGLIGRNGCGKTTLMKIINGEVEASTGGVSYASTTKIAYLKQVNTLDLSSTLYESVLESRKDFIKKQKRLQKVREKLSHDHSQENLDLLSKLEEEFFTIGGYDYETNIKLILTSLGFGEEVWNNKIEKFSGGEQTRIELAKILLSEFNVLLLDEPTNHLDLHMISWLEGYLLNLGVPYIIISHDKEFLNKTVKKIFEIENKSISAYGGNYAFYEAESALRKEQQEKAYQQQQKHIDTTMDFVRRNIGSQKTIQARSRLKQLEKLDIIEAVGNDKRYNLNFESSERTGNDVFVFEDAELGFPSLVLAKNINIRAQYQERIAIIGRNGCGKTTLIKVLMQEEQLLKGKCKIGSNINIGYFDQFHSSLDLNLTPKETIWQMVPSETIGYVLKYLARYGFTGDEVDKPIEYMSGGEKARLNLAVLIHQQPNVLLLDEPTNHLDIMMVDDLIKSLQDYSGTIIFVSHDRNFISKLANKFWLFQGKRIIDTKDEWTNILSSFLNDDGKKKNESEDRSDKVKNTDRKRKINPYILEKLMSQIEEKEDRISELESEKEDIQDMYSDPAIYADQDYVKTLKNRTEEIDNMLDHEYNQLQILEEEYLLLSE